MSLHTFSKSHAVPAVTTTFAMMLSAWCGSEETEMAAQKRADTLRAAVGHYINVRVERRNGNWTVLAELPKFDNAGNERSEGAVWLRCLLGLLDQATDQGLWAKPIVPYSR